ncbi:type III-A CRISPR-associated protein Csm2, partial [Fischerella thermalis CCMEE 5198]
MPELKKPSKPSTPQTNMSKTQNTVDENAKTIKNEIIKTIKN